MALVASCNSPDPSARLTSQASSHSRPQPFALQTESDRFAFPEGTQSLELTRMVGVRFRPGEVSPRIGTIAVNTRVRWSRTEVAPGCQLPWVEVTPQGWICGDYVKPSSKPPFGEEVPRLDRGEIVPGTYGKVTAPNSFTYHFETTGKTWRERKREPVVGSLTVRQYGELVIGGVAYWKVAPTKNQYVRARAITQHVVSPFMGSRLGDDIGWNVPIAFVWPRAGAKQAPITAEPNGGAIVRQVDKRTLLPVFDPLGDGALPPAVRVGDAEWMLAEDVRIFRPAPPPPSLRNGERWIDVDLDTQILVAFEGGKAVFATLVSSGAKATPTETGLYRIWLKESEADMNGLTGEDPYSVATVPWAQFFSPVKGLALHAAYWHDRFGNQLSHGCVNLAPRDARRLYYWTDPQIGPGWTSATGIIESPGSLIRVRSAADPSPAFKGYAKAVAVARTNPLLP